MNSFHEALIRAREQHRSNAGSVLDRLRLISGLSEAELARRLQLEGGVVALFVEETARADFTALSAAVARGRARFTSLSAYARHARTSSSVSRG